MVDAGNLGSVHPNMTAVLCAESASVLGEVDMSFEIPEDERDRSSCLPLNNAPIAQNGCEQARTCWQLQSTIEELRVKNEEIEGLLATIRKDLDEKELLLREVYHRVKNNLQVVKSLLSMGARSVGDGDGRDAIKAAERRIQVIASAHHAFRLYQRDRRRSHCRQRRSHHPNSIENGIR
jgi:two-component sensor histidine kinase